MPERLTFFENVVNFEQAVRDQQWPDNKGIKALEGLEIGMLHLKDGQTLYLSVDQGAISRFGEVVAEIPSLKVLRTPEALVKHIRDTTGLNAERIVILESNIA